MWRRDKEVSKINEGVKCNDGDGNDGGSEGDDGGSEGDDDRS